ncbi:MAG: trypsin-like peptidase domain-containing protein [Deltaproteobacteria bacterium]|nr:trypsin-like peptidase domain-containing protein [Deltaproteobacteria bacterium]
MPQSIDLVEASPQEVSAELGKLAARGVWRAAPPAPAEPIPLTSATYRDVTARVAPAVVNIFTQTTVIGGLYSDPLGVFPFKVGIPIPHRGSNLGSGFLIGDGYVITSRRVVAAAQSVEVQIPGIAHAFPAQVLGAVPSSSVAVLKVELGGAKAETLALASSAAMPIGEPVLAVGNPFGTGPTAREGILSFRVKRLPLGGEGAAEGVEFLQTTARCQAGDAGGPLVDLSGAVVGMTVLPEIEGSTSSTSAAEAGYAVPVDVVKASVAQVLSRPRVPIPPLP